MEIKRIDDEGSQVPELPEDDRVEILREILVEPKRKELENQMQGMKDLFIGILQKNREDYDMQLQNMKQMFMDVIQEDKKFLEFQLQSAVAQLPKVISEVVDNKQRQQFVIVGDPSLSPERQEETGMVPKVEAVRNILFGEDIHSLMILVEEIRRQEAIQRQQSIQEIQRFEQHFDQELNLSLERLQKALETTASAFQSWIEVLKQENAKNEAFSKILREMSQFL